MVRSAGLLTVRSSRVMRSSAYRTCASSCAISRPAKYVWKAVLMILAPMVASTPRTINVITTSIKVKPRIRGKGGKFGTMLIIGQDRVLLRELRPAQGDRDGDQLVVRQWIGIPRRWSGDPADRNRISGRRRAYRRRRAADARVVHRGESGRNVAPEDQLDPLLRDLRRLRELGGGGTAGKQAAERSKQREGGDTDYHHEDDQFDQRESRSAPYRGQGCHGVTFPVKGSIVTV